VVYHDSLIYNPRLGELQKFENTFESCYKTISLTDSNFRLKHELGVNNILYKDINKISFRGKNYIGDGILIGALGGFVSSLIICAGVGSASSGESRIGFGTIAIIGIPAFTILGAVIGWRIGANSYEGENYDLSKFAPDKRKEEYLKLIRNHQVNF